MLNKFIPKAENQTVNKVAKVMQAFKERLTFDNLMLNERYVKGRLHIILEFGVAGKDYVAVLQRCPEVRQGEIFDAKTAAPPIRVGSEDARVRNRNECDEQSMVLVGNVEVVEYPEARALPTVVRFGSVNSIYSTLLHALYSSISLGTVFCGVLPDGEAGLYGGRPAVNENELAGEMFKSASEVMNRVSSNEAEFDGRGREISDASVVIARMRVKIGNERIWLGFDELGLQDFKITDMLFGPFNLQTDEREPFVSGHGDSP